MTNHYHVVIETSEANLAQGMRQLNGVYTKGYTANIWSRLQGQIYLRPHAPRPTSQDDGRAA